MLPCFAPRRRAGRAGRGRRAPRASPTGWPRPSRRRATGSRRTGFKAKPGAVALLPDADGALARRLLVASDPREPWDAAALPAALPAGDWRLDDPAGLLPPDHAALGWALARLPLHPLPPATRPSGRGWSCPTGAGVERACSIAEATWLARDLVNTPANDLGPGRAGRGRGRASPARFGAELPRHRRRRAARGQLPGHPRRRPGQRRAHRA